MEQKLKLLSPYKLSNLLREQKDPKLALALFLNPNPSQDAKPNKPFRHSLLAFDIIINKLGRARLFPKLHEVLAKLKLETRFVPKEIIFCNVIAYYCRARLPEKAIELFDEIPAFRCQRTVKSFNSLLNGLLICREFDKMRLMFFGADQFAVPDTCTYNIMIHASALRGDLDSGWRLFDEMRDRGISPNAATFGTLIGAMCKNSRLQDALRLKDDMESIYKVKPGLHVYTSLISGLCEVNKLSLAFKLKDEMLENDLKLDSAVYTTLISALFKAGRNVEVVKVWEEMRQIGYKPDTATYNAMISGCCCEMDFATALVYLEKMKKKGCKTDVISYNTLLAGYCKDGKVTEACDLFEDMPRQGCKPDVVSYRIIFSGLVDRMEFEEATLILDEMIFKGYSPHSMTVNKLLSGLSGKGDTDLLLSIFDNMVKGNMVDVSLWTTVISAVCRTGDLSNLDVHLDNIVL